MERRRQGNAERRKQGREGGDEEDRVTRYSTDHLKKICDVFFVESGSRFWQRKEPRTTLLVSARHTKLPEKMGERACE